MATAAILGLSLDVGIFAVRKSWDLVSYMIWGNQKTKDELIRDEMLRLLKKLNNEDLKPDEFVLIGSNDSRNLPVEKNSNKEDIEKLAELSKSLGK